MFSLHKELQLQYCYSTEFEFASAQNVIYRPWMGL